MTHYKFPWSSECGYRWTGKSTKIEDRDVLYVCFDYYSDAHKMLKNTPRMIKIDDVIHQIVIIPVDSSGDFFESHDHYIEDHVESFRKLTAEIPGRLEHFNRFLRFNDLTGKVKIVDAFLHACVF